MNLIDVKKQTVKSNHQRSWNSTLSTAECTTYICIL